MSFANFGAPDTLNHNLTALNTGNTLNKELFNQKHLIQQLSTGLQINSAADNPSGNALATNLQFMQSVLNEGTLNAQDLNSAVQVANGAFQQISTSLQQIGVLAAQATNPLLSPTDVQDIQVQVNQLTDQINQTAGGANFAGVNLLQGNLASPTPAVASTVTVNSNANVGAQGQNLIAGINVANAVLNPPGNNSAFLNETFQLSIVPNGASAVTVNVTSSANPGVVVGSVGVNLAAAPAALTPLTITSSAPGGATLVAQLNFQNLSPTDIPQITNQSLTLSTTAFQPAIVAGSPLQVQVGAGVGQLATAGIPSGLNLSQGQSFNVSTPIAAEGTLNMIGNALTAVSTSQAALGATQNRLAATIQGNTVLSTNLLASESRITDLNTASATTQFASNQILINSTASLLSQANLQHKTLAGLGATSNLL